MHFREPLINENPKFLALNHVWMYGYWCCQVAILLAYNASVMFLLHSYQSIMLCRNAVILVNQVYGLFDWKYLKTEYTCTILILFFIKSIQKILNPIIPKACKKWPRNGKSQAFRSTSLLAFDKFWFLNFVVVNIERFAGINFASAVTETLYFLHPADCEHFGSSFLKFMCPW